MNRYSTLSAVLLAATVFSAQSFCQTSDTTPAKPTKPVHHKPKVHKETESERQVRELRESVAKQQVEIDSLKTQVSTGSQQATTAEQSAATAQTQAAAASQAAAQASTSAAQAQVKADGLKATIDDVKTTDIGLQETVIADQTRIKEEIESPSTFHYKGIAITPVAFFAFEGVYRNRSTNSGLATPFNSIPFPSANEGHVSELNFSGRQSRLGGLFEGDAGKYKLSGYFEADFLSAGVTSNNNQSNSYTLRQRQIWGQAATASGFAVTGGQMWSLITETGKSTNNRTEKLPATIDPNYMVGFSWERQPGIRLQQTFGDIKQNGLFTIAMSLEQAQITSFTVAGAAPANYFFAGSGTGGGLYNTGATYANNVAPDVIIKATLDYPHSHFEIGGIARFLRDYYFPILTTSPTNVYTYSTKDYSNTKAAGGVFGSARVSVTKFVDLAASGAAGTGIGRYGSAQLADATLRPDGTLEPIKNYHGLGTIETHPTKALDVFAYYGGEYDQRTVYANANGAVLGYGTRSTNDAGCYQLPTNPGGTGTSGSDTAVTCGSPTRYIQEGMVGFTYRVVNSPKYGKLQYSATYQLIQRNLWSGTVTGSLVTNPPTGPRAQDNEFHVGMRYYIP